MEFDLKTTATVFLAIIVAGTLGISTMPMTQRTIYMMVVPSMVVFGAIMLVIGVKHGEHRAQR